MLNPAIDRTGWPEQMLHEPDKVQWIDEHTGMDCLAVRHHSGHNWCGYVGVPPEHPDHGKDYDSVDVEVHGGLTFADSCQHREDGLGICHVPEDGRPDNVWWLGFDCAHSGDLCPGHSKHFPAWPGDRYRTLKYVQRECKDLALQLSQRPMRATPERTTPCSGDDSEPRV